MAKDYNTLKHVVRLPHKYAAGPVWTRFYEGLKQGKIYGTKCPRCNKVFVPARGYCPSCHVDMDEWIEDLQQGEIVSWAFSTSHEFFGMPVKPPFIIALIRLDGTDCNFLHFIGGRGLKSAGSIGNEVKTGQRVKAVWNAEKKGHMMDIMYFEPVA